MYLKCLPTYAAPTRRGHDNSLLRMRAPRTDIGYTGIPEGRDSGPHALEKETEALQQ